MFRLTALTTLIAFASLTAGCIYPRGGPHDLSNLEPPRVADIYNELIDTKRADYRASDPCLAAFSAASGHPSADGLGDASTRKAITLADLRRGIEASAGNAEDELVCAETMSYLFRGFSKYDGGSLFDPSPNMLTCLRIMEDTPRFATAAELDACLAAN